ncbi:Na/Pi cotransporter family protein [Salinivibrio kushneri]|uniref:Na/Pi cotransporter family protein n=1 Tax=Salinivibrio kushneri TaxID=1908198 RepID=UPI001FD53B4E|nr:Na/Pi cotransporter family protein [Salinivibrio kushneri]WBA18887.1 Na/Pi cotransporter family protein [Salinivibrio kushneri]
MQKKVFPTIGRWHHIALLLLLIPTAVWAAEVNTSSIHYPTMLMGLLGGLALFLYGMDKMSKALKNAAGSRLKALLAKLTTNRVAGVFTGAGVTATIQSSSVTTVLLIGFISAGLMSLAQATGVIMGANIGTTITAQIVAFKITQAAYLMVAVGFFIQFTAKADKTKQYGKMLFGLGLIFTGMNVMSEAMSPLRDYQPFIDTMAKMHNPFFAILLAALFTALVQSSSATTGIVIVLAGQGFISLEGGIALAMGANVGTCVTALLAAIGKSREAKQTASVHILFNIIGVLVWLPLISVLSDWSVALSPSHPDLTGVERLGAELPRQIANANTLFNVVNTLVMLPFVGGFVWLAKKIIPKKPKPVPSERPSVSPKYLSKELLMTPDIAMDQAQLEIGRIGRRVCNMMNTLPPLTSQLASQQERDAATHALEKIDELEHQVDILHGHVLFYLGRLRKEPLTQAQSDRQITLISMTDQLESIADLIEDTLVPIMDKSLHAEIDISDEMRETLDTIQDKVTHALLDSVNAIRRGDNNRAKQVLHTKRALNALLDKVLAHQAERLIEHDANRLQLFSIEMEWTESLKRVYTVTKRIAKLHLREKDSQ